MTAIPMTLIDLQRHSRIRRTAVDNASTNCASRGLRAIAELLAKIADFLDFRNQTFNYRSEDGQ